MVSAIGHCMNNRPCRLACPCEHARQDIACRACTDEAPALSGLLSSVYNGLARCKLHLTAAMENIPQFHARCELGRKFMRMGRVWRADALWRVQFVGLG